MEYTIIITVMWRYGRVTFRHSINLLIVVADDCRLRCFCCCYSTRVLVARNVTGDVGNSVVPGSQAASIRD